MSSRALRRAAAAGVLLVAFWPGSAAALDEEGCYSCHGLPGFAVRLDGAVRSLTVAPPSFESSVHAPLNCRECHSDVAAIPHAEPEAEYNCGQPCHLAAASGREYSHDALYWGFSSSVHGSAAGEKITCTLCHPAASLEEIRPRDKKREVRLCASCHRESDRVQAYFNGFHYRNLVMGVTRAPACPDCHTSHMVKSGDEAESAVQPDNLTATCGRGASPATPGGSCHGSLPEEAAKEADMTPLPLHSGGIQGMLFRVIAWGLLLGLVLRAAAGLARKR